MNFSVVIPTCNRPDDLYVALSKLEIAASTYPAEVEVLCVDNSTQDSATIAAFSYSSKYFSYKPLTSLKKGPSPARNVGILAAQYDHILFLDDDCIVDKYYFHKYAYFWKKYPNATILGGKVLVKKRIGELATKEEEMVKKHHWCFAYLDYEHSKKLEFGDTLFGANISLKKGKQSDKLFFSESLGIASSHHEIIGAEDYELCSRCILLGMEVRYIHELHTTNIVSQSRFSWRYLMKRYIKAGLERHLYDEELKIYGGKAFYKELLELISIRSLLKYKLHKYYIRTWYDLLTISSYSIQYLRSKFR